VLGKSFSAFTAILFLFICFVLFFVFFSLFFFHTENLKYESENYDEEASLLVVR